MVSVYCSGWFRDVPEMGMIFKGSFYNTEPSCFQEKLFLRFSSTPTTYFIF